jgi:hypothetical protein
MSTATEQFHQAMVDIYLAAKRDCNYNPAIFWNMVLDRGGLATARHLLATDNPSDGFGTLYMCGRLDLTVEAHVVQPAYRELFSPEEIAVATKRLQEYGYTFEA